MAFCAAFSGSKWSGVFLEDCRLLETIFCSSSWIEPSRFFTSFADRRVDMNDMTYGSPTTTTTSALDRDELGAALLFWNSSSDKRFCEHADRCQFLKREPGASEREREKRERGGGKRCGVRTVTEFE